jgi:hypothetical protein
VCADANAAARHQAKQRWLDKNFKYRSEGTKYHNREVKGIIGNQRIARGYSRATSDSVMNAYTKLGESFKATESLYKKFYKGRKGFEGGRSRTAQRGNLLAMLQAKGKLENAVSNEFGRNLATRLQGNKRMAMNLKAKNRANVGYLPEYGAPVMMPPSDRFSTFLNFALGVGGIIASDIREKENIEYVGSSPQGHNIWEFNYTGHSTRYRGAMAQEVAKLDPNAVKVVDGVLHVDYSKIDVDMVEVA